MNGLFITFEGVDGSGKTTQLQRLNAYVMSLGRNALVTREPGGTSAGLVIRELLLHGISSFPSLAVLGASDVVEHGSDLNDKAEALLYAADRAQHVNEVIRPALDRGDVVLCDRYIDSSLAYQAGGRELRDSKILDISTWATDGLMPRRTYLMDMDPAESHKRLEHQLDRIEVEGSDFQNRTRERFLELAQGDPQRYLIIDANQSVEAIWQIVHDDFDALIAQDGSSDEPADSGSAAEGESAVLGEMKQGMKKVSSSDPDNVSIEVGE
ncbi:MAG: dTMP kinase [Bifidobacterium aquikefiri]|uniref:Thymidylate kinase n=1 Tax=Bifidobacterium aquikefiri TaxID=1653207 RepID=A0A261G3S5_9BIFI|nr:dTMP kinase [Bifidobacterium aquikefiri]OZG66070.1 thymidylate kinase [Bifidobacterium aquikefiri]